LDGEGDAGAVAPWCSIREPTTNNTAEATSSSATVTLIGSRFTPPSLSPAGRPRPPPTDRDDRPHDLDDAERPCAAREPIRAGKEASATERQREVPVASLERVHRDHEGDRRDSEDRNHAPTIGGRFGGAFGSVGYHRSMPMTKLDREARLLPAVALFRSLGDPTRLAI